MNRRTPSLPEQLRAAAYSRRSLLKSLGVGAGLVGATRLPRWTAAQTAPSNAAIDALYHSAAAMPHFFAEFALPFVRRAWEMNGRGTLVYNLDTALAANAITPQDAALLGAPDTLYFASIIKPAGESWSDSRYLTIANYPNPDEAAAAAGRFVAAGVPAGASVDSCASQRQGIRRRGNQCLRQRSLSIPLLDLGRDPHRLSQAQSAGLRSVRGDRRQQ